MSYFALLRISTCHGDHTLVTASCIGDELSTHSYTFVRPLFYLYFYFLKFVHLIHADWEIQPTNLVDISCKFQLSTKYLQPYGWVIFVFWALFDPSSSNPKVKFDLAVFSSVLNSILMRALLLWNLILIKCTQNRHSVSGFTRCLRGWLKIFLKKG